MNDSRSLIGKFIIPSSCGEIEFVPASTSAKYRCEFLGRFDSVDVLSAIGRGEYVRISSWRWLTSSILTVDCTSVSIASTVHNPMDFVPESSAKRHAGQVSGISGFLRMKDINDPFNNSFCVHLTDGNIFVLRGEKMFLFRFLIEPGGYIEFANFRKIKLKSFENRIVWLSVDDSGISKFEPLSSSAMKLVEMNELRGRIISMDPPVVWITVSKKTGMHIVPIVIGRWGLCDKRRISVGAILTIRNFHKTHDVIGFCPASTCLVVEHLPPVTNGVISIHSFCAATSLERCFPHIVDGGSVCSGTPPSKFGINSLCACDCFVECTQIPCEFVKELSQLSQVKLEGVMDEEPVEIDPVATLKEAFARAMTEAEVCLSLADLADVFHHKAPPFFNTGVLQYVSCAIVGQPPAEVSGQLSSMPRALYLSLFPPHRPLHAFSLVQMSADGSQVLRLLVPRDSQMQPNAAYRLNQVLVLSNRPTSAVHAIILKPEALVCTNAAPPVYPRMNVKSPSKLRLSRRLLLRSRMEIHQ
jgi:hypothetical protein